MFRVLIVWFSFSVCVPIFAQTARKEVFASGGRPIQYEVFASAKADDPLLIVLPGTAGPESPFYRSKAQFYVGQGYTVLLLHYYDAAKSQYPGEATYRAWAAALTDLVRTCGEAPELKGRPVLVVGYSLGASVALGAGSQGLPVRGIAEWYGSLPDQFFYAYKSMPPLLILHGGQDGNIPVMNAQQMIRLCEMKHLDCTSHIYPEEGHGFSDAVLPDAEKRTLAFFREHRDGASAEGASAPHP